MRLRIRVKEINGQCPVYRVRDEFFIEEGYKLNSPITLCMHSLTSIMPYYVALSRGTNPQDLGLSTNSSHAYIQCLNPCKYTRGGTVIFEITCV
ncbi:MAG: TIGR04076 family protein [bacterium]|nr:TIGR04076 family protein [bacterium]